MADSVVSFLLQNVKELVAQESRLLGGVENQVRLLQNELYLINSFLENTKGKRHGNELVKKVVRQIRDVAYEAEDVIDTFIVTRTKHRRRGKLRKVICIFDRVRALHEVANQIDNIKDVIKGINDNRGNYVIGIPESTSRDAEVEANLHVLRTVVEENNVVGFNDDTRALVKHLIKGSSKCNVVSIIGMGGLGKTTLARKIYKDVAIISHFNVHTWVYVSQEDRIRELLVKILKGVTGRPRPKLKKFILKAELKDDLFHGLKSIYSLSKDKFKGTLIEDLKVIEEMSDEECKKTLFEVVLMLKNSEEQIQDHITRDQKLIEFLSGFVEDIYKKNGDGWQDLNDDELKIWLSECLRGKRYLIVMDDIWSPKLWEEVSTAFCDNENGSRILITSRIKEVALRARSLNGSSIPPYELPFLNEYNSWALFSQKVFPGSTCPTEFEQLGREIVKSCHGLPLAIVVFGGLLARKVETYETWLNYADHVNLYSNKGVSSCMEILALSYNHLPPILKPFFLYFGIYPEGFEIPVRQLFRLWIAEGFIRQIEIGNKNMEVVAEEYLDELIDRSLIQVATRGLDGRVKTCRIHDLLRDICIKESAEEKFLEVCSGVNLSAVSISRRISIHYANQQYISSSPCKPSNGRSIIGFGGEVGGSPPDNCYLKWICKSNKLVRLVELSNMGICCLIPNRIENLILLRYLSFRSGELHVIPDSICKLCNLETLDMRDSIIQRLPRGIWKLQKLRHLYLDGRTVLPITDNDAALPNIQGLTGIAVNQDIENLIAKGGFPNVRKLGLYSSGALKSELLSSLHPLSHLRTLKIYFNLFKVSGPFPFYSTLTKITLLCASSSPAGSSPAGLGVLGSLTNLRILKVRSVTDDRFQFTLDCNGSSFHQLKVFKIEKIDVLQWTMEGGAMQSLERLVIKRCDFHIEPPSELWCLTALQDVEVLHPLENLARMLLQFRPRDGCMLRVYQPN